MSHDLPQCQDLQNQVNSLLQLHQQEPLLRSQLDLTAIQASLRKDIAPTFEIVFAGAFSAGKSMLINALLERELLYSAEGHATGTECQIAYAEPEQERVVLTFMSEAEVGEQANALGQRLGLNTGININKPEVVEMLQRGCQQVIQEEGGESKSDRAKQASALYHLLQGFVSNREHIHTTLNNTFSMERFNFSNLQEAASYARRGANSAVLKRVEYYCHHLLLRDGNILVDTPGIDAPVKKDAELTYTIESQPQDVDAIKEQELRQLSRELKQIGDAFRQDIEREVNEAVASNTNSTFESSFLKLKARMVSRLDELLHTLSIAEIHKRAQASHKRHSVVPLLGILAEAFYYLADGLEDVLVDASEEIIANFFQALIDRVRQQIYYRDLYRLLGNDGGIEQRLTKLQRTVTDALVNEARTECDRYVRERPEFYIEGTVSIWQLRQTLQQACRGYDHQNMMEAEPAIRQLLKLDFEQKVKETVMRTFRQTINQTLNVHLLQSATDQADVILQQYDQARAYLARVLDKEAEEQIRANQRKQAEIEQNIAIYNRAASGISECLAAMQLDRKLLPVISESELAIVPPEPERSNSELGILNPTIGDSDDVEPGKAEANAAAILSEG